MMMRAGVARTVVRLDRQSKAARIIRTTMKPSFHRYTAEIMGSDAAERI
jgi:hypothetical protein